MMGKRFTLKEMQLVESHIIDKDAYADLVFDRDPSDAHPGGTVGVEIYVPQRIGRISLAETKHLIASLDCEHRCGPVNSLFPVFVSNLESVDFSSSTGLPHIAARIYLSYCATKPTGELTLLHDPRAHRQDVIETTIMLARHALGLPIGSGFLRQLSATTQRRP